MKKHRAKKTKMEKASTRRHEHEVAGGVAGALAGAAIGAVAGPPGAAAGAVYGGIAGAAIAKAALQKSAADRDRAVVDRDLDAEIGGRGGDLGATNLKHPPAKRGLHSMASSGAGASGDSTPAEGPLQPPEP